MSLTKHCIILMTHYMALERPALINICMVMQAELKKSGWSDAVIESLRYLFASEQETEAGSALDPLQWFQALFKYREIPNVMTAWKQELSEKTEQQVFQVSHPPCFVSQIKDPILTAM